MTSESVIEYLAAKTDYEAQAILLAAARIRGVLVRDFLSIRDINEVAFSFRCVLPGIFQRYVRLSRFPEFPWRTFGAYMWARCLRSIRLHRPQLIAALLRFGQYAQRFDLSRLPRETDETYLLRLCRELRAWIIQLRLDLSEVSRLHWDSDFECGDPDDYNEILEQPEGRCIVSLLDVAVLTGDSKLARFLASLGVPQQLAFESGDFINFNTGLIQAKNVHVVEAAACAGIDFHRDVSDSAWDPLNWTLLERAIAGKQRKVVNILRRHGMLVRGSVFMRVAAAGGWVRHMHFLLDPERVRLAVYAGLDMRSVRVNPWDALWYACLTCRSTKNFLDGFRKIFELRGGAWWHSQDKWRPDQTLLEIAINCGQTEILTTLIDLKVEATNLTSQELHSCFLETVEIDVFGLNCSINNGLSSLAAGRLAFQRSRFQHHFLIMQMACWWQRCHHRAKSRVLVQHCMLIDAISAFAASLPTLPEFDALTPPVDATVDEPCCDMSDEPLPRTGDGGIDDEKDKEAMAVESSIKTAHEEEAAHLSQALLRSKSDLLALSGDDVIIIRVTRRTAHVAQVLCESPHLNDCRKRVIEAQCDIFPAWANGACLLVPLTHVIVLEAELALHAHNIVALRSDLESLKFALSVLSNRQRPKLRPEHQAHHCNNPAHGMPSSSGAHGVVMPESIEAEPALPYDIELVVEKTFVHFQQRDASEASAVVHSAPAGCGKSPQPKNPRRWNPHE